MPALPDARGRGSSRTSRRRRPALSSFRFKLLLVASSLSAVTIPTRPIAANAFSPEIFNQIIVQLGTVADIGRIGPDELAFAAANLLDVNQRRRNLPSIISSISTPSVPIDVDSLLSGKVDGILAGGSKIIRLPKILAPTAYDYAENPSVVPGMLDLTPQEEELIRLILMVRNAYSPRTTIRIAGGWVRDKLIYGKDTPSRDVDLVLSDISGVEFADKVYQFVQGMKISEAAANVDIEIRQQPSSKGGNSDRLQNANLVINGFDVDFCRLRYEKYDKDSRIPTAIGIATVVEDAWRRDLTINALYYNINSNQVEDFTERGIRDLILQSIDTPLKPLPTLLQDPTRILRAIRFAAQLSFDMSPELIRAARDGRVKSAMRYKVSRDAVGKAIDEMLGTRARDPCRGMQLLAATNLIDVVFPLGESYDPAIYGVGLEYLSRTQSLVTRIFVSYPELDWDIEKRRLLWYAAFLKPVHELMSLEINDGIGDSKRRRRESTFYRLLDALKRPRSDVQSIEAILQGVEPILTTMLDEAYTDNMNMRSAIGSDGLLFASPLSSELSDLRWNVYSALKPVGAMWKEALVLALASSQKTTVECVGAYRSLLRLVEDQLRLGNLLLDKAGPRPLLNGSQVRQRALRGSIDGRDFKRVVREVEEWQVRNVFADVGGMGDEARGRAEARLVDHLIAAFPEYAHDGTGVQ